MKKFMVEIDDNVFRIGDEVNVVDTGEKNSFGKGKSLRNFSRLGLDR